MSNHIPEGQYKDFSRRVFSRSVQDPQPTRVQFELTYRCNIHCVHCYTDPFNTPTHLRRELSVDEMLRIFDELADAGALWLNMTGGEAVVHPQFRQIYGEAKRRGFLINLYSNGTTITESLADFLAANPPLHDRRELPRRDRRDLRGSDPGSGLFQTVSGGDPKIAGQAPALDDQNQGDDGESA